MSVKPIIPSIDSNNKNVNNSNKIKSNVVQYNYAPQSNSRVSFKGAGTINPNPIVWLMDVIETGGYAASFIIQDGLGFVAPRVGKGLVRGGKEKKDENGNPILDKNGKPKHELNWAYARKEGIREIVTGPSAFLIPYFLLKVINKNVGTGNNVKLNYIDGFSNSFTKFAKQNIDLLKSGTPDKADFYHEVFYDAIDKTINSSLPDAEKMSKEEISSLAKEYTDKQLKIEAVQANKSLNKKARSAKIAEIGTVEDAFMKLQKSKIGGTVNELAVKITSTDGTVKGGSIGELIGSLNDYFGDAVKNTKKVLKDKSTVEELETAIKNFSKRRMGSRILTNLGIFGAVAAFYTQIPKLYNMGLKSNPALEGALVQNPSQQVPAGEKQANSVNTAKTAGDAKTDGSKVPFTGMGSFLEKAGSSVFNSKTAKSISDIFELNGPIISGSAMPVLLYGFCIPPRLQHAQDKYDYGEIVVRDMTAFTALLFGAKALARLFSDGFTKITGLALNKKDLSGRNVFQKIIDYLNPHDKRHSVLSSKQLNSKYTNLEDYKGRVKGFMEFIENSGGNIKKAFAQDKNVKETVEAILKDFNGKSFKDATVKDIKDALSLADKNKNKLIDEFYKLFKGDNGLLRKAKTCNSAFGFLSTLVLVPGLIVWLTDVCAKMTERRTKEDMAAQNHSQNKLATAYVVSNSPSMAGFLKK